jgi:hypothetical protein
MSGTRGREGGRFSVSGVLGMTMHGRHPRGCSMTVGMIVAVTVEVMPSLERRTR